MPVYLGSGGFIELKRTSMDASLNVTLAVSDVNTSRKRFSVDHKLGQIITGDKLDIENDMILASQKATNLFKVQISDNDVNLERILSGLGRIRDVAQGPDGYVYIITTNTDGKAFPAPDDDKLLRILK